MQTEHDALARKLEQRSAKALALMGDLGCKLVTAESCTGGMIASAFIDNPGASAVFERGFVAYSDAAKVELLTVPTAYIESFGSVSAETVMAMAEGALLMSKANVAVSVSGVAGPGGGTKATPVGTVYVGFAVRGRPIYTRQKRFLFDGDRRAVRLQAALSAMEYLETALNEVRPEHVGNAGSARAAARKKVSDLSVA
jgi:nicotinamide-nucleotide amidase